MSAPNLTGYERLLPLADDGSRWLGRATKSTSSSDGIELVLIQHLSEDFLGRSDLLERIVEEADRASSLNHANIHRTVAAGYLDGDFSIVHAFPRGAKLAELLERSAPPIPVALRIVADLAAGLAAVHEQTDQIHGAISPSVVYVGWDGSSRLARFGTEKIVRRVRHNWGELDPHTLSYLSPEHCMNEPRDRRTDIFNLGVVLWELLTDRVLFEEPDEFERMRAICERNAPPPTRFNDEVPPLLNSLVLKALAIEPDERFPDASRMLEVFRGVLSRSASAGSEDDVAEYVRAFDVTSYHGWRRLERSRRRGDLSLLLEEAAELFDVDLDRARPGSGGGPTNLGDFSELDAPTSKMTTDITNEVTEDDPSHPVAQGFEVDEIADSTETDVGESLEEVDGDLLGDRIGGERESAEGTDLYFADDELKGYDPFSEAVAEETDEAVDLPGPDEPHRVENTQVAAGPSRRPADDEEGPSDSTLEEPSSEFADGPASTVDERAPTAEEGGPEITIEERPPSDSSRNDGPEMTIEEPPPTDGEGTPEVTTERPPPTTEQPVPSTDDRASSPADATVDQKPPGSSRRNDAEASADQRPPPSPAERAADEQPDEEPKSAHELLLGEAVAEESADDDATARVDDSDALAAAMRSPRDPPPETLDADSAADYEKPPRDELAAERDEGREADRPPGPESAADSPEDLAEGLARLSIDDWLEDDEENEEDEPYVEPFPIEDVLEDRGESEQTRVRKPALEIVRLGETKPFDVTVLRGRDRWSKPGLPIDVRSKGSEATVELQPPCVGWVARANSPGTQERLPSPPAHFQLKPGDVAKISDGAVTYRFRFFHPPRSPNHIERQNLGTSLGIYAVAVAIAVAVHALAALGIVALNSSFGVAFSVESEPRKEVFAAGKLEEPDEPEEDEQEKPPEEPSAKPEPPKPPEPEDPAEQEAKVPETVQREINERMQEKRDEADERTEGEALAAALQGSDDEQEESVGESISNIDAVDSPSETSSDLEVGGKLEGTEGNDVQIETGSEATELGDIGSKIGEGAGDLEERDAEKNVRGTVDSVESQAKVEGRLDRAKVTRVVRQHNGEIQGCYEQQLLNNPGLSGKITFEWTITRAGAVSGARQKSSTLGSSAASNCILRIIRKMTFPKPKGGSVSIRYPFMFRSSG